MMVPFEAIFSRAQEVGRMARTLIDQAALGVITASSDRVARLLPFSESMRWGADLRVADAMVSSYTFDPQTGISTFSIPAGVTDSDAMRALNIYVSCCRPQFNREAIYGEHLSWFKEVPERFPRYCQRRDASHAREVAIHGLVADTEGKTLFRQISILSGKGLRLSDPRDQAIAAAIHACKHDGDDLFQGFWVRGAAPGVALATIPLSGVFQRSCEDTSSRGDVAASGCPIPQS